MDANSEADLTSGETEGSFAIDFPTYDTIGDYWYKLTERQGFYDTDTDSVTKIAGMIYGTNDSKTEDLTAANGAHDAVYYVHVQVTSTTGTGYNKSVTIHKTAPDASYTDAQYNNWAKSSTGDEVTKDDNYGNTDNKVSEIDNKYLSGSLLVKKTVTGNFGDKNRAFKVKVVFTKPTDQEVNSDIAFSARKDATSAATAQTIVSEPKADEGEKTDITWDGNTATAEFFIKDSDTVTFSNIPYGVTYEVTEPDDAAKELSYKHTFTLDSATTEPTSFNGLTNLADTGSATDATWDTAKATGGIADESDTVTITNEKNLPIDVGVLVKNAPYIALIALAGVVVIVVARRRKSEVEE